MQHKPHPQPAGPVHKAAPAPRNRRKSAVTGQPPSAPPVVKRPDGRTPPLATATPLSALVAKPTPPAAPAPTVGAVLDINGFDPAEFEWRPVPRRLRKDGWTPEIQRAFIEQLAITGMVDRACLHVDRSVQSAYRLRVAAGAESFARAWKAAIFAAADQLVDIAYSRAIEGEEVPVYDRDGCRVGTKRKYNTQLLMHLLRAYRPERFRHAHESVRHPGEQLPPPTPPVAEALATLTPVTPPDPHMLTPPERMTPIIADARAVAERSAAEPIDDTEPFLPPPVPADHPLVVARARARHARERAKRERYDDDVSAHADVQDGEHAYGHDARSTLHEDDFDPTDCNDPCWRD